MPEFQLVSDFQMTGDQPLAVQKLVDSVREGVAHQTLMGVTGSGKTFTMANIVQEVQRPTLVLAHNKTLAAQLASEFKEFFPHNAVEYFVSYYDYYQPEAYVPQSDTYVEKDASVNEELDKLRLAATTSLLTRRDVLIVASVSCIYGLGDPSDYFNLVAKVEVGEIRDRSRLLRQLIDMQYERNDYDLARGRFRVRGDTLEIVPAYEELAVRIQFFGDEVEKIVEIDPLTGELLAQKQETAIYPAKHFVTTQERLGLAVKDIEVELEERLRDLRARDKILEAARLESRTNYDLEMLREAGFCHGVENYSCHLARRHQHRDGKFAVTCGSTPWTLLDYFPEDFLMFIDESHMTLPQVRGMYHGDVSRKNTLVDYGFRLPSAVDNRPLNFGEFEQRTNQVVFVSATPGPYEMEHSAAVVEQVIRPTGLLDPTIEVKPTTGQIDDLLQNIKQRVDVGQRCLVTTLDQADVRGAGRLPVGNGDPQPLPPLRHRNPQPDRNPPRPAPGRLRRYRRNKPPSGGLGPPRGEPGRHPGRRQGGLSPVDHIADPDHRARGPPFRRARHHVRRPDNRLHEAGLGRDGPPPRNPARLQPAQRDRTPEHPEGGP